MLICVLSGEYPTSLMVRIRVLHYLRNDSFKIMSCRDKRETKLQLEGPHVRTSGL